MKETIAFAQGAYPGENENFHQGFTAFRNGKPYVILATCPEWRRGWVQAEADAAKVKELS